MGERKPDEQGEFRREPRNDDSARQQQAAFAADYKRQIDQLNKAEDRDIERVLSGR